MKGLLFTLSVCKTIDGGWECGCRRRSVLIRSLERCLSVRNFLRAKWIIHRSGVIITLINRKERRCCMVLNYTRVRIVSELERGQPF